MDLWVQAVTAGTLIGAAVAVAIVVVLRRRRARTTRNATSQRLADLHTSYDSLKAAMLAMDTGDYAKALAIGEQVFESGALAPHTVSVAHLLVGEAASKVGAHRTAVAHLPEAIEATRRGSLIAPLSALLRMQAKAAAELCEYGEALQLARQATESARVNRDKAASLLLEAEIRLVQGDFESARAVIAAATDAPGDELQRAAVDHLTGRLLAAEGDLDGAATRLQTAIARYQRSALDQDSAARVMVDLAEVAYRIGDVDRARSLIRSVMGGNAGTFHDRPRRAVTLAKAAAIEAAAGNAAGAEQHLEAAAKLFATADLPSAEAYLSWARSRVAAARGDAGAAGAALRRAEDEATRLGMGAWRDALRRERESGRT